LWDAVAADSRWHSFTAQERSIVDDFVPLWGIKRGQAVLEPGCGSGRLTEILAALTGPTGRVVAFDRSREFMRIAARRGLPAHVHLRVAGIGAFRIEPAAFDHVLCFNAYPHLVPQRLVARRLARALRPGGVLWIAHTCSRRFVNEVHRGGPAAIRKHLLPDPAGLTRQLRDAGLVGITIRDGADRFLAKGVRPASPLARSAKSKRRAAT
jgi:SAM-dependent methyltransferase